MGEKVLIAIACGFFLMGTSGAWANVTVSEERISVPEEQRVTGAPEGLRGTATHRVHKRGAAFGEARPEYITGYGYTPSQISEAYGFSGHQADGAGQTVAIVVACGSSTLSADLDEFNTAYGLLSPTLNIHRLPSSGQPDTCSPPNGDGVDWGFEASLDVEWVHALAPGATIDLVVAPTEYLSDLFTAVQYAAQTLNAQVVSMSWGADEFQGENSYDSVFSHPGTVFIAASGDSGSGAQYPASSRNVVAVGGTSLYLKPNAGRLKWPEVAWGGSGGGVSQYEAMPAYQSQFAVGATRRSIPDVAFDGDEYTGVEVYDSNYGPPTLTWVAGGTSLSAQCWAAIIALADQLRANARLAPLTDGHHAIYTLAGARDSYKSCYSDITWGYNGNYAARPGYDFITGLGSPIVGPLIQGLSK